MNKEMLQKCFRMTSGIDEPATRKGFAESVEKVGPQKSGVTPTDEGPDPTTTVTSLAKGQKLESELVTRYMEVDPKEDLPDLKSIANRLGIKVTLTKDKVKDGPNAGYNKVKVVGTSDQLRQLARELWGEGESDFFDEGFAESVEDDDLSDFEYDDRMTIVGDDEPEVAVIDTDLTPDDEDDASPVDYVGKNIVVCPVCLNPLFSDKAEGEIYCPICDQEVEIDHAEGVVVAPEEQVVSDQVDVDVTDDGEEEVVSSEEEGEEQVESVEKVGPQKSGVTPTDEGPDPTTTITSLDKNQKLEAISDKKPSELSKEDWESGKYYLHPKSEDIAMLWDASYKLEDDKLIISGNLVSGGVGPRAEISVPVSDLDKYYTLEDSDYGESLQAPPSNKSYMDYTVADLDSERCGGDPQKILDQYKQGLISDKNFTRYIAEGKLKECDCTKVSVCPQGGVEVTTSSAEVCVAPQEESTLVKVDDVDTDTLDAEVNDVVSSIYGDEDITYESKNIYRQGKGFVVEGVITSKGRSKSVKLVCSESFDKRNVLRFEGFTNALGRIVLETSYNPRTKKLMTESSSYKVLVRKNGKSRVVVG